MYWQSYKCYCGPDQVSDLMAGGTLVRRSQSLLCHGSSNVSNDGSSMQNINRWAALGQRICRSEQQWESNGCRGRPHADQIWFLPTYHHHHCRPTIHEVKNGLEVTRSNFLHCFNSFLNLISGDKLPRNFFQSKDAVALSSLSCHVRTKRREMSRASFLFVAAQKLCKFIQPFQATAWSMDDDTTIATRYGLCGGCNDEVGKKTSRYDNSDDYISIYLPNHPSICTLQYNEQQL